MPVTSGLEALERAGRPGPVANLPSLQIAVFEYLDTKVPLVILVAIGGFVGWIGVAWAVGFLGVTARARQPTLRRFVPYLPIVGGVVLGVSVLMSQLASLQVVNDFLAGPRTVQEATTADNGVIVFSTLLYRLGTLVLAVGVLLVALNSMRVGLLTRMLGYIGIASGAMMVLFPLPIVQIFWLGSLGSCSSAAGRAETRRWATGEAVPWPVPSGRRPGSAAAALRPRPGSGQRQRAPSARRKRKKRH